MAKHTDKIILVVVPTSPRQQVLNLCQNVKSVGHLDIEKHYWPNVSVECYDYEKFCSVFNIKQTYQNC